MILAVKSGDLPISSAGLGVNLHFKLAWNRKLPVPTVRYPRKDTRYTRSHPCARQLWIPLMPSHMNNTFVRVLINSAIIGVA